MDKKHIYYISYDLLPSEKAAPLCAVKTALSLKNNGVDVTLLVPRRLKRIKKNVFDHYSLSQDCFKITYLPLVDICHFTRNSMTLNLTMPTYIFSLLIYLLLFGKKDRVIYARIPQIALALSFFGEKVLFEIHKSPSRRKKLSKWFFNRMFHILTCSAWQVDNLKKEFDVSEKKISLARSAVDLSGFTPTMTREVARKKLNLSPQTKIVLYTGNLFKWKGVDILASAAEKLGTDIQVYIIGGARKKLDNFRDKYSHIKNLNIIGYRQHKEMPWWQWAANVLVIPNTAKEQISLYDTSPIKLFEYMATKTTPIVASNISSITEIANEKNAILVEPDDPEALAETIKKVLDNGSDYLNRSEQAFKDVQQYTWDNRAKYILSRVFNTTDK